MWAAVTLHLTQWSTGRRCGTDLLSFDSHLFSEGRSLNEAPSVISNSEDDHRGHADILRAVAIKVDLAGAQSD